MGVLFACKLIHPHPPPPSHPADTSSTRNYRSPTPTTPGDHPVPRVPPQAPPSTPSTPPAVARPATTTPNPYDWGGGGYGQPEGCASWPADNTAPQAHSLPPPNPFYPPAVPQPRQSASLCRCSCRRLLPSPLPPLRPWHTLGLGRSGVLHSIGAHQPPAVAKSA